MAKNLGGAIIELLDSERVELRAAAATVLAAVGKGDKSVEAALTDRLADDDGVVRRIALEGLADMGAGGIAAKLVPLLRGDDEALAERAAPGARAAGRRRREHAAQGGRAGPVAARRVMAQLLLRRGTQPAIDAVLDQLSDHEFGEQALQLCAPSSTAATRSSRTRSRRPRSSARARRTRSFARRGRSAQKAAAEAEKAAAKDGQEEARRSKPTTGRPTAPTATAAAADPLRDPEVAHGIAELGAPAAPDRLPRASVDAVAAAQVRRSRGAAPDPARRDRRPAPHRRARARRKGTEKVIEALIEFADGDDLAVAQSAVDTLRGARIPESLAKTFGELAKSKNVVGAEARDGAPARRRRRLRGQGARRGARRRRADRARRRRPRPARRHPRRCCR